jgi:hypothetical protein
MGILDDAIRDHLDLKRRHGADEPELKKLEDEAFGPPGRPDASGSGGSASAVATPPVQSPSPEITPEDLGLESLPESPGPAAETPPPDGPAPEEPPAPSPEPGAEPSSEGGTVVFHDFAAEEGLVAPGGAPAAREPSAPTEPTDPVERALAQPTPEAPTEEPPEAKPDAGATQVQPAEEPPEVAETEQPTGEAPPPEPAVPVSEDTQVHDMAKELDLESEESSPPSGSGGEGDAADEPALELDVEDLDIELTDGDASGDQPEGAEDESEDVLEETPEFLRDAPESDRLWFEQGKPKDFDFDEE